MLLYPHKSGGDAATRGIGTAVLYLGLAALVVLPGLNLLPWQSSKYTAFALVMAPLVFFAVSFGWAAVKRMAKRDVSSVKPRIILEPGYDKECFFKCDCPTTNPTKHSLNSTLVVYLLGDRQVTIKK